AATLSPELLSSGQQAPEPQAQAEPEPETPSDTQSELDLVQIGDRELSRKLYMIFLAEADELIELLCADALSWQREPERSPTEAAIRAAHSLAGSSAIVGLEQVRQIAALIEQFMLAQQHAGRAPQASDFEALLELTGRVRAMLHQFAGGADPREDDEALALARALASDAGRQPDALTSEPQAALFASGTQAASTIPLPVDEIDPEFLPVFIEEASDLMPQIGEDLRRWQAGPAVSSAPETLMRRLHTVKGSARMAGAMGLGQLLHEIETRLEALAALPSVSAAQIDELIAEHDRADSMFQRIRGSASEGEQPALSSVPQAEPDPGSPVLPNQAFASEQAGAGDDAEIGRAAPDPELAPEPRDTDRSLGRTRDPGYPQPMLRVRADLLDRLVDEAGEVSIARSRLDNELTALRVALGELTENVNRLRSHLRDIEIQAESQIQARIAQQREHEASFDPLEFDRFTRSQELTRMLAESVNDVATVQQNAARSLQDASQDLHRQGQVVRDLQQNLMRMRMLRFGSISDRLHRVVRQTARQLDKQAHLEIRGPEVEIDRSVLERMAGPIEHLLRNAVMHGIESPAQRLAQGKPESGQIRIEARQEGRDITLVFSDDGAGLNLDRIRERALQTGLLQAQSQASPGDLAELIFSPGFSTASTVTEIAGRGVGMDAVRSEIAGLGGSIKIESTPGKGTSFQVLLPLSLAVAQGVLVCAGEHRYAINSSSVEKRLQVKPQELAQSYGQGRFECEGTQVPLHYLGTLVDLPGVTPLAQHHAPVLILRSGTKRIALHCDEVS
ncbi:MAG: chemotaxis protein CheA, partial [Quisquiliibacterium sp.]